MNFPRLDPVLVLFALTLIVPFGLGAEPLYHAVLVAITAALYGVTQGKAARVARDNAAALQVVQANLDGLRDDLKETRQVQDTHTERLNSLQARTLR